MAANLFGQPSAALGGVPVRIANRREINPDKTPAEIVAQRASYAFAHKVIANSRAAADRLQLERVPARKIAVVPNGIDCQQFRPRRGRDVLRKVVVVANLRPQKGHDVLLDAIPIVLRRFPDALFELVGSGSELEPLRARALAQGLSQRDHLSRPPGRCERVPGGERHLRPAVALGGVSRTRCSKRWRPACRSWRRSVGGIPELIDERPYRTPGAGGRSARARGSSCAG